MSSTEKRQSLKHATTYQVVNGGICALVVFHVGGFYNARYYSPLPLLHIPFSSPHHRQPPTLAGCGLHPATFTSLFPSTYANEIDILQTFLFLPHLLHFCCLPLTSTNSFNPSADYSRHSCENCEF